MIKRLIDWGNSFSIGNRGRTLWEELMMQLIEQPLHFLMGFAAVSILIFPTYVGLAMGMAAVVWIVVREWQQWPSSRIYDPPLDWSFLIAGGAAAFLIFGGIL